ncbi:hypothetical protein E1B28_002627 [Marasmius oreades]|uniref:Uncharacterized protein n=1 Tax=Marasmius oreades TaxID=181124 RepID=A0A9P7UP54_9AGAR|nr:uncharacterized protein E1B28_002627 [Marasmius oreades]KAG7086689.1 hypothetical protein E1B28_002627 [Marasmius oreades]
MRKDRHFGRDDPILFPQPFVPAAAHLAVVRVPSLTGPFTIAWLVPSENDFKPSDDTFCAGFGVFDTRTRSHLVKLAETVVKDLPANHQEDYYMKNNLEQLRRLLDRLQLAAPKEEVFLRFRCAQRHLLELDARSRWVTKYRAKFGMARELGQEHTVLADENLMGAFTDNLDDLENLFQSHIPVYYVRPLSRAGEARVDRLEDFILPLADGSIQLHTGFIVDMADATPSHRVVFTGLARNPERYITMANYVSALFEYPSVLGTTQPRSSTSIQRASLPLTPSMPIRRSFQASRGRPTPYPKGKAANGKHPQNITHNTFIIPSSPLVPLAIEAWKASLEHLSGHNQSLPAPEGANRGYALPPPDLFITSGNETVTVTLFRNWLKLRNIFIYRLSSSLDRFSKKQWRQMLTFDDDKDIRSDTRTGQQRLEMQKVLKDIMGKAEFRPERFSSAPVIWRGGTVDRTKLPPQKIAQEILWELYELNFCQDLVALDDRMDESGMSTRDRSTVLEACWIGSRDYAELSKANRGLHSTEPVERMKALKGLHTLMSTWSGSKPTVLLDQFPEDSGSHNLGSRLDYIERELAYHYTSSFLQAFGRAASIPFRLS